MTENENNKDNNNLQNNNRIPSENGRTVRLSDIKKPVRPPEFQRKTKEEKKEEQQKEQQKKVVKKVVKKIVKKIAKKPIEKTQNEVSTKKIVKKIVKKPVNNIKQNEVISEKIENKEEVIDRSILQEKDDVVYDRSILADDTNNNSKNNTKNVDDMSNAVIKSATNKTEEQEINDPELKKIVRHKSRLNKFFRKYGLLLIIFFVSSLSYLSWMHIVPMVLNYKISLNEVNNLIQPRLGYKVDYQTAEFYTTSSLAVGVKFRNFKLIYPHATIDDKKNTFLKARVAVAEMPVIPFMMKTISFNELSFRSVTANLYKNSEGKYVFIEQIKNNFKPNAPKYVLEVPDIIITSYIMPSYDAKTNTFKQKRGAYMKITSKVIKETLKSSKNSNTIQLK